MSKVDGLVGQLHAILKELVEIEHNSNKAWRQMSDTLNELDHEMEIISLNGAQLLKVASFRKKLRLERRSHKHNWLCSKAFNDSFHTEEVLSGMSSAFKSLRRQQRMGENLIEDRGLIARILSSGENEEEVAKAEVAVTVEKKV